VAVSTHNPASPQSSPRPTSLESVGGKCEQWTVTPTLVAAAYATGETLGTDNPCKLVNAVRFKGGSGIIQSITLADKAKQSVGIDLVFFKADPSATTFTDNSALTVADADLLNIVGVVSLTAADYYAFADNSVAFKGGLGIAFNAGSADSALWVAFVSRGAYTAAAVADLQATIAIMQD
jgi:hypothetical protein